MATMTKEQAKRQQEFVHARQAQLVAAAKENGGAFTDAQQAEFDALDLAYESYAKAAKPQPFPRQTPSNSNTPLPGTPGHPVTETHGQQRDSAALNVPYQSKRMADLFRTPEPSNFGYDSSREFFAAIAHNNSQRLMVGQNTISNPAGGWAVPESFAFGMMDRALETEVVRPRCQVVPMETDTYHFSDFDDRTHANGQLFGGLYGQWLVETGTIDYKTASMLRTTLTANKLGFLVSCSNELLSDAPQFEGKFTKRMADTIGFNLDRTCLVTGTGVGQPESALNSAATITVSKEAGQPAATIIYENLVKMFARMHPECLGNAVWVVNQTALPQLLSLSLAIGSGGVHIPVMTKPGNSYEILGRPVVFTEKLNALGTLGDILFVDLSQYVMGIVRNGLRIDQSAHVKLETDQTVFRTIWRGTGKTLWQAAFTPTNGDTLSWAVALQTR